MYLEDENTAPSRDRLVIPDPPLTVVPVAPDVAQPIREFTTTYPNLGYLSVYAELRRANPSLTVDEVRTVMAAER